MYQCADCESAFNNAGDLSCHITNVHKVKHVKCKHCNYKAASQAHMCLHVQKHTSGIKCSKCQKSYPSKHALELYQTLHAVREKFVCPVCEVVFATVNSLHIHTKGKHGSGYVCKCGSTFPSPVQRLRHTKKCAQDG